MSGLFGCAVCFGEPDAPMTLGAQAGVFVLLGVIVAVLGGISFVLFTWSQRAKLIEASQAHENRPATRTPVIAP